MTDQDKILQFLKVTGPTLPSKVAKHLGSNILIASAHLSDLRSQGKIKLTNLKIGGSPLYYLPGHESQIYPFAAGNINTKNHQVLERLKQNKVLREKNLETLPKVALRALKDFAIPLHVTVRGKRELFWKWYLLTDEETKGVIAGMLRPPTPVAKPEPPAQPKAPLMTKAPPIAIPATVTQQPISELSEEPQPTEVQSTISPQLEPEEPLEVEVPEVVEEDELAEILEREENPQKKKPKPILKKIKEKITKRRAPAPDKFLPTIETFFINHNIIVEQKETIRKNSELDFVVTVPSIIGTMKYFCKAKSKARCDEKDLAAAYMEAQVKKLPLLFLYTKDLTKKAQEMIESGAYENAIIKKTTDLKQDNGTKV